MSRPPLEEKAGAPLFLAALGWGLFVLSVFTLSSFRSLGYWGALFDAPPVSPGAPGLAAALASFLHILLCTLAVLVVAWVSGRRFRAWLGLALPETWVKVSLDFVLGTALLGFFWIGTGLNGLWFPVLWKVLGIPCLALCLLDLWRNHWKEGTWTLRVFFPREAGLLFLFLCGLWYLGFSLLQGLVPESFYDSMVYHLAVPARWLLHHGLGDYPANFFSNLPFAAETFFLNGLALQGTEAAKLLHLASFGVACVLAGGWARELAGERAGWLTFGMTATFPLVALCVWTTQVEGFLALACLAFLYALDRWMRDGGGAWAAACGLFAGTSLAVKYTAFPLLAAAFLVMAFQRTAFLARRPWGEWAAALAGGMLSLGPWVVKNLCFTGNPFFPYFMGFFPGRRIPHESYLRLLEEQQVRLASDFWGILKLPWTLTMSNPDAYIFAGPLALGLFPLLLLYRYRNPSLRFLCALALLLFLAGLSITHILKFSVPAFLVLYLLLGTALGAGRRVLAAKAVAWGAGVAALACFSYLASIHHQHYDSAGVWWGRVSRDEYLQSPKRVSPYQGVANWINRSLPPGDRVLVVGGSRGLYLKRSFLNQSVFDEQVLKRVTRLSRDAGGILEALKREGVDDLLILVPEGLNVADYRHYDLTVAEWTRLEDFIQRGTDLLYLEDLQGVYRLRRELSPRGGRLPNLALFLSEPAANFVLEARRGRRPEALEALTKVLALYPFSEDWRTQARLFREAPR